MSEGGIDIYNDIRVVFAIDFGTTFSGYAYAHKENPKEIIVKDDWKPYIGRFKTPTVIKYEDDKYTTVKSWGFPALAKKPKKKKKLKDSPVSSSKPIELFKLHFLESLEGEKPFLPDGLDYRKVVTDFMRELSKDLKNSLNRNWNSRLDFYSNVKIVLTVPAEYDDKAIAIFRECVFNAGLIKNKYSNNLKITTETEATAIYCLNSTMRDEHKLIPEASFMIVDCSGGTVDLTTRELLEDDQLSKLTERTRYYCGSCFIDQAFLKFLGEIVGKAAIESIKKHHYCQLQYIVQEFCNEVKIPFTGIVEIEEWGNRYPFEFDLEESLPMIKNYVEGEEKTRLQEAGWQIEIGFKDIKKMFDSVIDEIINLIKGQLDKSKKECSAIFLVGGFSESKYLQTRVKEEFCEIVPNISVPPQPIVAVLKGGI
ncbi:hypothetical protein C1645_882964 [Glomus cerebriforme]|uniref:Actin-like ATPase domain-containing protein n=1 Tax=Glomus cerebriforme TaxID=658196 RepID=A0A397S982_9GLOM|nr:hypothetical protein C1645_882964 [Glomus cerebriforme]